MAAQKFKFVIFFLLSSCATASDTNSVQIDNQLSACISLTSIKTSNEGKVPVLSFDLRIDKPIAECGCKSALGSYTVFSKMTEYKSFIIGGKIGFAKSGLKTLPLSAEPDLIEKKKLVIGFACAQPD